MAVDERRRSALYDKLARTLGSDEAATMFELLPPAGTDLVTRADVDPRFASIDQRFDAVDLRFDAVDRRLDAVDLRFDAVDQRLDAVDLRFDAVDLRFDAVDQRFEGIDSRLGELHADVRALRGELTHAVSSQGRTIVLAVATTTVSIGGLSAVLAQLI